MRNCILWFVSLALIACTTRPAEPERVAPDPRRAWEAVPTNGNAWVWINLSALRADPRFATLLASVPDATVGVLGNALRDAERGVVVATDAAFSDRVHILEGAWDGAALRAELLDGTNVARQRFAVEEIGESALFVAPGAPWAVAWDGARLLFTGPATALRPMLVATPRYPRTADPSPAMVARWEPPSMVTRALAQRLGRPELSAPLEALRRLDLEETMSAGVDLHLRAQFSNGEAVVSAQAAITALAAIGAAELQASLAPGTVAPMLDALTFERSDQQLDVWWELDRRTVQTALDAIAPEAP